MTAYAALFSLLVDWTAAKPDSFRVDYFGGIPQEGIWIDAGPFVPGTVPSVMVWTGHAVFHRAFG